MANKTALFSRKFPGGVFTIQDVTEHPGDIYFVDSGQTTTGADAAGYGQNPDEPFLTIDYAIGQCTAAQGDVIYVLPGHAETVSGAAGIDVDVEGISIIGLGNGDNRPTITFTGATADMDIDAENVTIENLRFIGGVASLAAPIDVNQEYFTIRNCEFMASGAGYGVQISIITDANCNDIAVEDCTFQYLVATDGTTAITQTSTEAIRLVGADRAVIKGCYFSGDFTTSAINCVTTASKDIKILNNHIYNIATENIAGAIDLAANTTGFLDGNICHVTYVTSAAALIDDASCVLGLNYVNNATSEAPALHGSAETIGVEAQVAVIDGLHDVPTADTSTNSQMRDVIGNNDDAAASGAASTAESLMAYAKQTVGALGTMSYNGANYLSVTADGTSATWNTAASHEIATVTGLVRMRILPVISTSLTGAGSDICLGTENDTDGFIAATSAVELDDTEIWWTSTAASNLPYVRLEHIEDQIVNSDDVGYEVAVAAFGTGSIIFHIWWEGLDSTGAVAAGAGGTL